MIRRFLAFAFFSVFIAACAPAVQVTTDPVPATVQAAVPAGIAANPFYALSTLPFQAPPFDRIKDTDYQPAFIEGMRQKLSEIEVIANQGSAPTFQNTIVPMELAGAMLFRVSVAYDAVNQANTNDLLQKIDEEMSPKRAANTDAIFLNDRLYRRVKSVYDTRASSGLDAVQQFLVERYYRDFVRAGAQLSESDKTRLRALNQEESQLTTTFHNKLLAGTKAGALVTDNPRDLEGLSEAEISGAAATAKQRGWTGKWAIALQNTTQQPSQLSLVKRATREKLFLNSTLRGARGDSNDTRFTVSRLAQLRAEKARLLGYPSWADFRLENVMARTSANALKLLTDIAPAATSRARTEARAMQALIDRKGGGFKLQPWDWQFYAEQVRKQEYDLDESQLKPYFELNSVLQNGVFFAANKLYGITFRERHDIPVYHPDVRVFDVFDVDGKPMALFYADFFKRDNKSGGAWMDVFVEQSGLQGTKPVVFNVSNFAKPVPGKPALISMSDATTMFHEFGHALHGLFSNVMYPRIAGTNVPRDYVEFPSQFNEHWALEPSVLANYAKHYETGAPMPKALLDKFMAARKFNQGFKTTESVAAMLLDMAWHSIPAGLPLQDVDAFEAAALKRFNVAVAEIPPRYRTNYFSHIWDGGYSAGYYSYLWSEVIDDDAYAWFRENGGMTRANGQRFREMILSRGGSADVATLYRNFRGRDPSVDQLLIERGLKGAAGEK